MDKPCSRRGCDNKAIWNYGTTQKYCDKHYRFHKMVHKANQRYSLKIKIAEIEELFNQKLTEQNLVCPKCQRKMVWHSQYATMKDVITLQHWANSLGFLCFSCNAAHGSSNNENILDIPPNKKWCPKCQRAKSIDQFDIARNRKNNRRSECKTCRKEKYERFKYER